MEIDGHPTQDLIEELERRGAMRLDGGSSGPRVETLRFVVERVGDVEGLLLFLPLQTFETGFDQVPQ
jgi:hypothetical protein